MRFFIRNFCCIISEPVTGLTILRYIVFSSGKFLFCFSNVSLQFFPFDFLYFNFQNCCYLNGSSYDELPNFVIFPLVFSISLVFLFFYVGDFLSALTLLLSFSPLLLLKTPRFISCALMADL